MYLLSISAASTFYCTVVQTELSSFLIEITALIFKKKDEDEKNYILDSILDKTGMKGTGTVHLCSHASVS